MTFGERRLLVSGLEKHSLSLAVGAILTVWFVLCARGDPSTHSGAFYGNALADWLGSFMIVITTKYFLRAGIPREPHAASAQARPPCSVCHRPLVDHSAGCYGRCVGGPVFGVGSARQGGASGRSYRFGMYSSRRIC